jgi:hypothetical protein
LSRHRPTPLLAALALALFSAAAAVARAEGGDVSRVTAVPGQGVTLRSDDGRLSLNIKPRIQLRDTFAAEGGLRTNEVNLRTLRLSLSGQALDPRLRWGVQLALAGNDFDGFKDGELKAPVSASPVFDAFLEYEAHRDLVLKVGQFFVPFDRARTIREFALQFVDRQLPVNELNLDRDIGLALSSNDLLGIGVLGYALFVGGGRGRNAFGAQAPTLLATARATWHPFGSFDEDQESDLARLSRPRLAVGLAAGRSTGVHRQRVTLGVPLTVGEAAYRHAAADLVFKYSGFALLAEALWRRADEDRVGSPGAAAEWTRSGAGRFVQAGYLGTAGYEVAAKWEQLVAHAGTDPKLVDLVSRQGRTLALALNRYFNGHALKLQSDVGWTYGDDVDRGRLAARLQLDATF